MFLIAQIIISSYAAGRLGTDINRAVFFLDASGRSPRDPRRLFEQGDARACLLLLRVEQTATGKHDEQKQRRSASRAAHRGSPSGR